MRVTAKFVNPPKEGKKLGTIKDQNDNYHYFDPKKFSFTKGAEYEIDVKSEEFQGKTYSHVTAIKGETAPAKTNGSNGASGGERWWMPFVSNTVAHAIQAARIEGPADIQAWAAAAKAAALALDRPGKAEDMESDIPW